MQLPQHPLQAERPASNLPAAPPPRLFRSFWLGGFESSCHIARSRQRLDMIEITQHDTFAREDYRLLTDIGIRAARDAVRWHKMDHDGRYDFAPLAPLLDAALETEVQVVWTLCHYGWPQGLELLSADFVKRFAAFAYATAEYIKRRSNDVPFYCPVNEISYFSWAAGHIARMYPFYRQRGHLVKQQLVRAAIAAMDAVRTVEPQARFVQTEPIINVVPSPRHPELAHRAIARTESQFEAWDMMLGKVAPELGGGPQYLDIAGLNFYHNNQWVHPGPVGLHWHKEPRDPRWVPLHRMLAYFHQRYRRPLFVSETSHVGVGRAAWIREIADEVAKARGQGVPVEGVCLFPILDRPDWDNLDHWHNSGLWDLQRNGTGKMHRILNPSYYAEFCRVRDIPLVIKGNLPIEPA